MMVSKSLSLQHDLACGALSWTVTSCRRDLNKQICLFLESPRWLCGSHGRANCGKCCEEFVEWIIGSQPNPAGKPFLIFGNAINEWNWLIIVEIKKNDTSFLVFESRAYCHWLQLSLISTNSSAGLSLDLKPFPKKGSVQWLLEPSFLEDSVIIGFWSQVYNGICQASELYRVLRSNLPPKIYHWISNCSSTRIQIEQAFQLMSGSFQARNYILQGEKQKKI